ncbi:MAG: ATP-binding cassette domain-containing protein [Ruminococcus sp.]|nr:ATP-binding cassette domain-containing protein [Ruminococcus sp.]
MEITVRNLTKEIENIEILKNINLQIGSGEAAALVGANGAGKTTLINCILNVYTKYSGEILFDGLNVKLKEYEKNVRTLHLCWIRQACLQP